MKNFIIKYIPPHLTKGILLFGARSLHSLSSLIFSFLVGRILTIEEHGLYSQYLARIVVLQSILEVGLQYSIIKYLTPYVTKENYNQIKTILKASLFLKFIAIFITLIFIIIWTSLVFIFPKYDIKINLFPYVEPPEQITQIWLVYLSAIGMSFFSYLDAILVSNKKYKILILWIPATGIIRLTLLFFFFFANEGNLQINHVLFSFLAGTFLSWPLYFFYFDIKDIFDHISIKRIKYWIFKLLSYNQWILLASFFAILSDWMELFMIQNQASAGIFNAARIPMQGILILLTTMQSFILPTMSHFKTANEFKEYFIKIYKYIIILIILLLPVFYIGYWFIPTWFGEEYYESVQIFWIIYPGFLLRLLFAPLGSALFVLNQPVMIAIEAGLRMMGSYLLNFILIPYFGIMGAALASVFSQFFGWIFLLVIFFYYFRTGYLPDLKKITFKLWEKS